MDKNCERQSPLIVIQKFTFADFVSGVAQNAIEVPANAICIGGDFVVDTAWNSATSDTFIVGDSGDTDRYKAAINGQTAARTALVPTGYKYTTQSNVSITWTGVGTAPTAGAGRLIMQYAVAGRAHATQG